MAIYHLHTKIIGRSKSGSSTAGASYISGSIVAGASYRAGEKIKCDFDGRVHDYTHKTGVVYSEIMRRESLPTAPRYGTPWN